MRRRGGVTKDYKAYLGITVTLIDIFLMPHSSQSVTQSISQSVCSSVSWAISNAASQVVSLSVCWQTSSLSSAASQSIYLSVCPSVRQPANQSVSWSVYHSVSHTKLNLKSYLCDGSLSGDIFMTATTFPRSSYSTSLMPGGRPYWACWQTN